MSVRLRLSLIGRFPAVATSKKMHEKSANTVVVQSTCPRRFLNVAISSLKSIPERIL
jgi:hypothetical protein